MEFDIMLRGRSAGICKLEEQGLYWSVDCMFQGEQTEGIRLFCDGYSLGLAEREGERWLLKRRISRSSSTYLPPKQGTVLALKPFAERVQVLEYELIGYREEVGDHILFRFPYRPDQRHPCMPLFCFFSVQDGFWVLRTDKEHNPVSE